MKRWIEVECLCLAIPFLIGAVGSSAALADGGQIIQNAKKQPPVLPRYKETSGLTFYTNAAGTRYTCQKDVIEGTIVGGVMFIDTIAYINCTVAMGGKECKINSVGAKEGEIKTTELTGELGEIATGSGVGILLEGEETKAKEKVFTTLAATECAPEAKVTGSVIGEVTPVGKLSLTDKEIFTTVKGAQSIKKIERSKGDTLVTASLQIAGNAATVESTEERTFEEELEVTAGV
jgi:hypothetical protein